MAADGSSGVCDSYGFLCGLGMALGANLVEQVYSPWYTQPGGMLLLMTESYRNGASLSGNSWGPFPFPLGYDGDTRQVDVSVQSCAPAAVLEAGEPLEAFPDRTVTHTLTLTNSGPSDSFILSLSGNAWDAQIVSANPVTVTSGAAITILVQVQVPEGVALGSDTFTLTAASVNIPGVQLTAQGTTIRLAWIEVFLPVMRK
jgi:hypothetical protein